jgi:hypothetical protein
MRKAMVAQSVVAAIALLGLSSATAAEANAEAQGGIIMSVPPEVLAALKRGDNKDAGEHFMKLHEIMRDGVGVPKNNAEYVVGPWL